MLEDARQRRVVQIAILMALATAVALLAWRPEIAESVLGKATPAVSTNSAKSARCAPAPKPPNAPLTYYEGPLIDSHFHIPAAVKDGPDPAIGVDVTLADMVCSFDVEGTVTAFGFFPVYPDYPWTSFLNVAKQAKRKYPTRFVRFLMPPGVDDIPPTAEAQVIAKMLKKAPRVFQGYGEIGLYEIEGRSADDFPPDAAIFQEIYPVVQKHNLLVYLHPGEGQKDHLARALEQNPDITFIVHGEEIEPFINSLMKRYPNIFFTADDLFVAELYSLYDGGSKVKFLTAFEEKFDSLLAKGILHWKPLIETHPDRFLWGTDRGDLVWHFDPEVGATLARFARTFIGELDPSVQEKFAYTNAQRLIKRK